MESFTTVTAHYLTSEWPLEETVLSTEASEERHTAVNIANCIREVVDKFALRSKVVACVHDNTANVMLAGSMLEEEDGWKNIGCAAHLLHLAVNMGLEDVASIQ